MPNQSVAMLAVLGKIDPGYLPPAQRFGLPPLLPEWLYEYGRGAPARELLALRREVKRLGDV